MITLKGMRKKYHSQNNNESGNALVYVLVAIVLFAALSFTLTRQTDTDEAGYLSDDKAALYASEIISYTAATKSAVDQMLFSGSNLDNLDFILPSDAAFDTGSDIHKLFHPQGGGLNYRALRSEQVVDSAGGVYIVQKDVEWTDSTGTDVILSFYNLNAAICAELAEKIDNTQHSPSSDAIIDDIFVTQGDSDTLDTTTCPTCENKFSAVIENASNNSCTFYTVLTER